MNAKNKTRHLPQGWNVDISYISVKGNAELCGSDTRSGVIEDTIRFCDLKRSEFRVKCVVTGYNKEKDVFDFPVVRCDSKAEAIEGFWQRVKDEFWFERMGY